MTITPSHLLLIVFDIRAHDHLCVWEGRTRALNKGHTLVSRTKLVVSVNFYNEIYVERKYTIIVITAVVLKSCN